MRRILIRSIAILFVLAAVISVAAQDSTSTSEQDSEQAPRPKRAKKAASKPVPQLPTSQPPDMVCFGEEPAWSIQFVSWGARYLGVNQPDKDFPGAFFWEPAQKVWMWQRENNIAPVSTGDVLSATIQTASCTDPQRKGVFPFAAVVSLPQGDLLSGCCRKLKEGEAPAAPHATPSNKPPAQRSAPASKSDAATN